MVRTRAYFAAAAAAGKAPLVPTDGSTCSTKRAPDDTSSLDAAEMPRPESLTRGNTSLVTDPSPCSPQRPPTLPEFSAGEDILHQSATDNLDQSATDNLGQSATDNLGQSATNNLGQSATDNLGQSATDNLGQSTTDNLGPNDLVGSTRAHRSPDPDPDGLVSSIKVRRSPDEPANELSQIPPAPTQPNGQKRAIEDVLDDTPDQPQKRPRASPAHPTDATDPVAYWAENGTWPTRSLTTYLAMQPRAYLLAKLKPSYASSHKRSGSGVSGDPRPPEEINAQYAGPGYEALLQSKGSYMEDSDQGITDASERLVECLLSSEQYVPGGTIFDDSIFGRAIRNLRGKNEARVVQDISRLIVPSAETLALYNNKLECLIESVNEGWNHSNPLLGSRPQPDYSVGFNRQAFTDNQLKKLAPFIGDTMNSANSSYFLGTFYMYFPFLTCETKCGNVNLDIANRQNAHSMTLAVRAVTELFRYVERENEVHREILAFSVSHDNKSVRIYGHYPVIDGMDTKYYCRPIREFYLSDGREKWTAYRFTKNLYEIWMPEHLNRICSAIDQVPLDPSHPNTEAES